MGSRISAVLRAKEQTGLRVREGRYAKPLSVMGDATPTQFPSSNPQTAQLAPAINRNQSDRRTGAPIRISHLLETAQRPKNCQFLSLQRDRSRKWAFSSNR